MLYGYFNIVNKDGAYRRTAFSGILRSGSIPINNELELQESVKWLKTMNRR